MAPSILQRLPVHWVGELLEHKHTGRRARVIAVYLSQVTLEEIGNQNAFVVNFRQVRHRYIEATP